jgi:hypothetical protein
MYSPLLPAAIGPNDYVSSVGVTLACYQQAGSGGKYVGISGKWSRLFTLTQILSKVSWLDFTFSKQDLLKVRVEFSGSM